MLAFWNSVAMLRQIEFVTLLIAMIVPVACGTLLLSVHYRIKSLVNKTTVIQGSSYEETLQRLENMNLSLRQELQMAQAQLGSLRHLTAPRQLSAQQAGILSEQLRGIQGSPVIVSAYAFEEESAAYATQIATALRNAGWVVTLNKASMNDFKGVTLSTVKITQKPTVGLHELAQAFSAAHLEVRQHQISPDSIAGQLEDGSLLVVVGRK